VAHATIKSADIALTVTKKLPYPALGRVATGDASQRHENQRHGLRWQGV